MSHFLFTSESVGIGHPDKIADQLSDSILDACLSQDRDSRVACEVMVTSGLVLLAGEITTRAEIDHESIVRHKIQEIGYNDGAMGFDYRSCGILASLKKQSPDIARGVNPKENGFKALGAGDQGIMFGFACDETPELMPLPIMLAHHLCRELNRQRNSGQMPFLRPDAKSQVTIEYDAGWIPKRIHTVVLSAQHKDDISHQEVSRALEAFIHQSLPSHLLDKDTRLYVNPTGRFVIGGPAGDCGLTGRKTMVDTYGGMGHHGGGAFSGKDPTKVDRSASYAVRYVAKNIVAAKLARRCEVQVSYAIGIPYPISIHVDTFQTGSVSEERLAQVIPEVFDLSPEGMITSLDLKRPIYQKTAFGGHFGRQEPEFTWEKTDRIKDLQSRI